MIDNKQKNKNKNNQKNHYHQLLFNNRNKKINNSSIQAMKNVLIRLEAI